MTLKELSELIQFRRVLRPEETQGQALIGCLLLHEPEVAGTIVGTALDPYNDDRRIRPLLQHLAREWQWFGRV